MTADDLATDTSGVTFGQFDVFILLNVVLAHLLVCRSVMRVKSVTAITSTLAKE